MIWLLLSGFFLLALGILVIPLFRYRDGAGQQQAGTEDIVVYKAQLQELDADRKNDLMGEGEAISARLEIERRLLRVAAGDKEIPARPPLSRTLLTTGMAIVLLLAMGLYLEIGMPGMPDFILKNQQNSRAQQAEQTPKLQDLITEVAALKLHLGENPKDIKAWRALGQYQTELHHPAKAVKAFEQWYQLDPDNVDAAVVYAESLIVFSGGRVVPAAMLLLERILKNHPDNPGVRHYLALAQYQAGNIRQALASWQALEADSPPLAPWLGPLRRWIRQARADLGLQLTESRTVAPTLSDGQRKAIEEMSPEQQKAMIGSMVGRLADKMSRNPENIEGWFRLARAYMVLGQRDDAVKSLKQALEYAPDEAKARIKKQLEILLKKE